MGDPADDLVIAAAGGLGQLTCVYGANVASICIYCAIVVGDCDRVLLCGVKWPFATFRSWVAMLWTT